MHATLLPRFLASMNHQAMSIQQGDSSKQPNWVIKMWWLIRVIATSILNREALLAYSHSVIRILIWDKRDPPASITLYYQIASLKMDKNLEIKFSKELTTLKYAGNQAMIQRIINHITENTIY